MEEIATYAEHGMVQHGLIYKCSEIFLCYTIKAKNFQELSCRNILYCSCSKCNTSVWYWGYSSHLLALSVHIYTHIYNIQISTEQRHRLLIIWLRVIVCISGLWINRKVSSTTSWWFIVHLFLWSPAPSEDKPFNVYISHHALISNSVLVADIRSPLSVEITS